MAADLKMTIPVTQADTQHVKTGIQGNERCGFCICYYQ